MRYSPSVVLVQSSMRSVVFWLASSAGPATRMREARAAIGDFTVLVHPREPVSVVREDEADNRILECALAAGADAIVTGDHHLLELGGGSLRTMKSER